jgi:hypothetical protein
MRSGFHPTRKVDLRRRDGPLLIGKADICVVRIAPTGIDPLQTSAR